MDRCRSVFILLIVLSFGLCGSGASLKVTKQDGNSIINIPASDDVKRVTVVEFANGTSATGVTKDTSSVMSNVADADKNGTSKAEAPEALTEQSFNSTSAPTTESTGSSAEAETTTDSSVDVSETSMSPFISTSNLTDFAQSTESTTAASNETTEAALANTPNVNSTGVLVNPCGILHDGIRSGSFDTIILPSQCVLFIPPATVIKSIGQTFSNGMQYTEPDMDMPDNYTIIPTADGMDIISRLGLRAINSAQSSSPGVILTRSNSSFAEPAGFPVPLPSGPMYSSLLTESIWQAGNPFKTGTRRSFMKNPGSNRWINRYPSHRRQQPDKLALLMTVDNGYGRQSRMSTWGAMNKPEYFKRRRISESSLGNLPSWFALVEDDD